MCIWRVVRIKHCTEDGPSSPKVKGHSKCEVWSTSVSQNALGFYSDFRQNFIGQSTLLSTRKLAMQRTLLEESMCTSKDADPGLERVSCLSTANISRGLEHSKDSRTRSRHTEQQELFRGQKAVRLLIWREKFYSLIQSHEDDNETSVFSKHRVKR